MNLKDFHSSIYISGDFLANNTQIPDSLVMLRKTADDHITMRFNFLREPCFDYAHSMASVMFTTNDMLPSQDANHVMPVANRHLMLE